MDVPVIKGKLRLKGRPPKRAPKRERPPAPAPAEPAPAAPGPAAPAAEDAAAAPEPKRADHGKEAEAPRRQAIEGTGKVSSSGRTLTGHGTEFRKELKVGDAVDVVNPDTAAQEIRVVTMVLSDTAASLSAPFPSGVREPSPFRVLKAPARRAAAASAPGAAAEDDSFAGEYSAAKGVVRWREKVGGSYTLREEAVKGDVSRSDLLAMRSKRKRDKFC